MKISRICRTLERLSSSSSFLAVHVENPSLTVVWTSGSNVHDFKIEYPFSH